MALLRFYLQQLRAQQERQAGAQPRATPPAALQRRSAATVPVPGLSVHRKSRTPRPE